jgi:hypothetical protein
VVRCSYSVAAPRRSRLVVAGEVQV